MAKLHHFPFTAFFFLVLNLNLYSQQGNRPLPEGLPAYVFFRFDTANHGYYLSAPFDLKGAPGKLSTLMILDADGYLVWYKRIKALNLLDFKFDAELQQYAYINYPGPAGPRFTRMDTGFQLLDTFTVINGVQPDAHDFELGNQQSVVVSGMLDSVMDLSSFIFAGKPGSAQTHIQGFVIQEIDTETHALRFQWNSNDHIHPSLAYDFYGYSANNFDYCHGNSIEMDANGDFLLSFRHLNAVYKIRRSDGSIAWQLGGKTSSFAFPNDAGFSGQHDARWLPNGHISLFDNANMAAPPQESRAVEYELDTVNWTATKVWEYRYQPGFFSIAMGGHQTTGERLHLVNYGLNYRPEPSFVLTDDSGNLLSTLFFQDSFMSYRSYIFDLPFPEAQRPLIHCSQDNDVVTLSAPPGYNRYEWSTGEKTASITAQATGAYQVWVDHGASMLGSKPFFITDPGNVCKVNATETPETPEAEAVLGYFDLLGRRVRAPEPGQVLVVQYGNGRAKLEVWRK